MSYPKFDAERRIESAGVNVGYIGIFFHYDSSCKSAASELTTLNGAILFHRMRFGFTRIVVRNFYRLQLVGQDNIDSDVARSSNLKSFMNSPPSREITSKRSQTESLLDTCYRWG